MSTSFYLSGSLTTLLVHIQVRDSNNRCFGDATITDIYFFISERLKSLKRTGRRKVIPWMERAGSCRSGQEAQEVATSPLFNFMHCVSPSVLP